MASWIPNRPPPRPCDTPARTVEPEPLASGGPTANQAERDLEKDPKIKRKGHEEEGDEERRRKNRRRTKDDSSKPTDGSSRSRASTDLGSTVSAEVLKDSSVLKALRASINKHGKALAEDLIVEVKNLQQVVQEQNEGAAKMTEEIAALKAELSTLKARRSPSQLKNGTVQFFNKVLLSQTYGDEFNSLARLSNQAWGHEVFKELQKFLLPKDQEYYAEYYYKPDARRLFEEAVHNFRRGGAERLQPSVLNFLQSHPDFPSVTEIDNYTDDLDSKLLGEFVFQESEPSGDEREDNVARYNKGKEPAENAINEEEGRDQKDRDQEDEGDGQEFGDDV